MEKINKYDEFLHKIQQAKMQEIWDNKEDDIWNGYIHKMKRKNFLKQESL